MAEGEVPKAKERPYPAPFIVALVMFLILSYLFFDPDLVGRTRFTFSQWVTIGYLITLIMLVLLAIWKVTIDTEVAVPMAVEEPPKKPKAKAKPAVEGERTGERKPAPPKKKKRVVVATGDAAVAADAADMPPEGLRRSEDTVEEEAIEDLSRVVEYPPKEPGGVYSDTLVRVDENLILNLRILLGKVCHNCEELDDCKRRVEGKLDGDVFLANFECKDGIKRELQRARKKREAEEQKASDAKEMVKQKADGEKVKEKKAPVKKKSTKKGSSTKGGKQKKKDDE
ncbi:hypothetical protein E2P71_11100 [Candidatus Bathyarchaeota archaeon]|nr:hypothetical protein E2P71_11100 [Candidatus Bathyarchaeota archaeon]